MERHSIFDGKTLITTYAYYDRPVLFTARNSVGAAQLIVLKDEGLDYEYETWLSVTMSPVRLEALELGFIDFYDAFKLAESGACVETTTYTDGRVTIAPILCEYLTQDDLPMKGERVGN